RDADRVGDAPRDQRFRDDLPTRQPARPRLAALGPPPGRNLGAHPRRPFPKRKGEENVTTKTRRTRRSTTETHGRGGDSQQSSPVGQEVCQLPGSTPFIVFVLPRVPPSLRRNVHFLSSSSCSFVIFVS